MNNLVKSFLIFCSIVMFFSGCASSPKDNTEKEVVTTAVSFSQSEYAEYWESFPEGDVPLFLGTSKRFSDREAERNNALVSAAFRAIFYQSVKGFSRSYFRIDPMGSIHLDEFDLDYDKISVDDLVETVEKLEVVKELQDNRGTYILVRFPEGADERLKRAARFKAGLRSGNWVDNPPEIPGYMVSVGHTLQYSHPSDSVTVADKKAMEEMIKSISTRIYSEDKSKGGDGANFSTRSIAQLAEASIKGFCVIARYVSSDGKNYYSLGICPDDLN